MPAEKKTQAQNLIELIAISGEFPSDLLKRLSGGDRYKEKLTTTLKKKKLIHTYYRDGLRGYRLTSKSKEMLLAENPVRFGFYLTGNSETNLLKSEILRRLRLHRIAEAHVTMQNAGVEIFRDRKPDFFCSEETFQRCTQLPAT